MSASCSRYLAQDRSQLSEFESESVENEQSKMNAKLNQNLTLNKLSSNSERVGTISWLLRMEFGILEVISSILSAIEAGYNEEIYRSTPRLTEY